MESFETIRKLDEGDEDGEIGDPLRPSTRKGPTTSEALSSEIKQKIQEAFKIFDHENNNTVDVREIGTIIRSLGFCPSEGELQEVLRDMEDPQQVGYIQFDRFYPEMSKIIIQHKYQLHESDELLRAFEVLDTQNKGHFTIEELRRYFVQYGEPFSSDEMEEMLNAAVTSEARLIQYKTFLHYLSIDEEQRL